MSREERLTSVLRAKKFIENKKNDKELKEFLDKRLASNYPLFSHFFVWLDCMEFIREFYPEVKGDTIPDDLAIYIENERKLNLS